MNVLYTPLTYTIYALLAWAPKLLKTNPGAAVVPDPGLFHGFNLVLHLLSVLILWRILLLLLNRSKQPEIGVIDNLDALPLSWAVCGSIIVLGFFLLSSSRQVPYWRDTQIFFEHALQLNPNSFLAHTNLGLALAELGRHLEAIEHHREALRAEPKFAEAHNNLGFELAQRGEFEEAMQHVSEVLCMDPDHQAARQILERIEYLDKSSQMQ